MKIIVAEKPSVAKGIAEVIGADERHNGYIEGNGYRVTWCVGHLIELCNADEYDSSLKKWNVLDLPIIPDPFKTKVSSGTKDQFETVSELINANDIDEVIEATDAGREGELIFRLVYYKSMCKKPVKRLWIASLEATSIRNGLKNLKDFTEYDNLYKAAQARQEADWLLGINLTRWYTCSYNILLAAGRVQTPTVNFIVEREREIQNFKPVPYWVLTADLGEFSVSRKETEPADAKACENACKNGTAVITSVEKKEVSENPKPLYDITSLQQDANRIFGYSAQETLDTAQSLYEKRLSTYPRTDSRYITEDQRNSVSDLIDTLRARGFYNGIEIGKYNLDRIINDKKVSDHHALLPTVEVTEEKLNALTEKEKNVLTLILWKLIIAVGPTYVYETTQVKADINGYSFECSGKKDITAGFKTAERAFKNVLGLSDKSDILLPDIQNGAKYSVKALSSEEKETTPASRYTEATLLSAMETCGKKINDLELKDAMKDKGLGTAATRASIIESIIKNGYIERRKKVLIPTDKAFQFIDVCTDMIKKPELTAKWEYQLAQIQKGELDIDTFLTEIKIFLKDFVRTAKVDNSKVFSKYKTLGTCPKCGSDVCLGKYGAFCSGKCGFTVNSAYGKAFTETQIKTLLAGKPVTHKGLVSKKSGKTYDAILTPTGVSSFTYTGKDGAEKTGYGFDYKMAFPERKKQ